MADSPQRAIVDDQWITPLGRYDGDQCRGGRVGTCLRMSPDALGRAMAVKPFSNPTLSKKEILMTKTTRVPVSHDAPATRQRPVSQWTGFGSLRDEVERLFDSFEPRLWFDRGSGRTALTGLDMPLCPAIDLTETETGYAITAELPGLNADEITIKTTDGTLSISGEKAEEREEKEEKTVKVERSKGQGRSGATCLGAMPPFSTP